VNGTNLSVLVVVTALQCDCSICVSSDLQHLKCRFWVYQNSEELGAWNVSRCISIKRKIITLDPGT